MQRMSTKDVIESSVYLLFIGLFLGLCFLVVNNNEYQEDWKADYINYKEEIRLQQKDLSGMLMKNNKVLNKLNKRMQISGCLLR